MTMKPMSIDFDLNTSFGNTCFMNMLTDAKYPQIRLTLQVIIVLYIGMYFT